MSDQFLRNIPKVELHLHLEGAIPLSSLWKLVEKYGKTKEVGNFENLKNKFYFNGFQDFLDTWKWLMQFLNEYEDYEFAASEVAKYLREQKYRYAELFFAPARRIVQNFEPARIAESIIKGFHSKPHGIDLKLIVDVSRDFGETQAMYIMENVNELKMPEFAGIGMGGTESKFPPQGFTNVFKRARDLGLKTTVHAGEGAGSKSVWDAVKYLEPDRIGHGASAMEDPKLVEHLKKIQMPIEMCPISNVKTNVVSSIKNHPVADFYRKGLMVTVNTDDPTIFNNNLAEEYEALITNFGFTYNDIRKIIENTVKSAWCDPVLKNKIMSEIDYYFERNGNGK